MPGRFKTECRRIIFQSHRWDEKAFDIVLILAILFSVAIVLWESVPSISDETPLGQLVASIIMIIGYGIIAVPTAIVTAEMTQPQAQGTQGDPACPTCGWQNHDHDAAFCKVCGDRLPPPLS